MATGSQKAIIIGTIIGGTFGFYVADRVALSYKVRGVGLNLGLNSGCARGYARPGARFATGWMRRGLNRVPVLFAARRKTNNSASVSALLARRRGRRRSRRAPRQAGEARRSRLGKSSPVKTANCGSYRRLSGGGGRMSASNYGVAEGAQVGDLFHFRAEGGLRDVTFHTWCGPCAPSFPGSLRKLRGASSAQPPASLAPQFCHLVTPSGSCPGRGRTWRTAGLSPLTQSAGLQCSGSSMGTGGSRSRLRCSSFRRRCSRASWASQRGPGAIRCACTSAPSSNRSLFAAFRFFGRKNLEASAASRGSGAARPEVVSI